jgi:poly(beta-D-mannuronate) lyase
VISFRKNSQQLANYSRVTETVIDNFNNPERFEPDYWVAMYGVHNRFDHNHLEGKRNKGVTMAVRLDSAASRDECFTSARDGSANLACGGHSCSRQPRR